MAIIVYNLVELFNIVEKKRKKDHNIMTTADNKEDRRDGMKHHNACEDTIMGAIEAINRVLKHNGTNYSRDFEPYIAESYQADMALEEPQIFERHRESYLNSVKMLVAFLDHKDEYTKGHCERVTRYAVMLGQALAMDERDIMNLELAALLHDIGKLAVPDDIINKEGKLTAQEYDIIKMHPAVGYELIKDIAFLEVSKNVLLQHHERIDGKGYPLGLNGAEIDTMSRILSIADAYDAMTSSRPYRKDALSKESAIGQLKMSRGSQFDTDIVDVFIRLLQSDEVA